jgi:peptidoglycan-N-acetylglucosamine deacetylase
MSARPTEPRLSVNLSLSFDATSLWISKGAGATEVSRGEFGAVAMPRILDVFKRHEVRTTFFVPGHTALAYPDLVRRIRDEGHEIGHHTWVHENAGKAGAGGEREIFERGFEALDRAAGVRPVGYRAAGNDADFSEETVALIKEFGFVYDSSCFGSDYSAYYLRAGDEYSPTTEYVFGVPSDLVELPCAWMLDDFNLFEFRPGYSDRQAPIEEVFTGWREEFDHAYAEAPGGTFNWMLHDQAIGRGPRLRMLERYIEHMNGHDGVVFEPLIDYVERWKAANPLEEWIRSRPVQAGLNAIRLDGSSASKAVLRGVAAGLEAAAGT